MEILATLIQKRGEWEIFDAVTQLIASLGESEKRTILAPVFLKGSPVRAARAAQLLFADTSSSSLTPFEEERLLQLVEEGRIEAIKVAWSYYRSKNDMEILEIVKDKIKTHPCLEIKELVTKS